MRGLLSLASLLLFNLRNTKESMLTTTRHYIVFDSNLHAVPVTPELRQKEIFFTTRTFACYHDILLMKHVKTKFNKPFEIKQTAEAPQYISVNTHQIRFLDYFYNVKQPKLQCASVVEKSLSYYNLNNMISEKMIKYKTRMYSKPVLYMDQEDLELEISELKQLHVSKSFDFFKIYKDTLSLECKTDLSVDFLLLITEQIVRNRGTERVNRHGDIFTGFLDFLKMSNEQELYYESTKILRKIPLFSYGFPNKLLKNDISDFSIFFFNLLHMANLASKFYQFDYDNDPFHLLIKLYNINEFLYQKYHQFTYNKQNNTSFETVLDRSDSSSTSWMSIDCELRELWYMIDEEYLNFMKIYRDQYRLAYTQFLHIQFEIDETIAVERLLLTKTVLSTIHWLVTITCNYVYALTGNYSKFRIYDLNFDQIENLDVCDIFEETTYNITTGAYLPQKCGIYPLTLGKNSAGYISMKLLESMKGCLQLPVYFYINISNTNELGIKKINELCKNKRNVCCESE